MKQQQFLNLATAEEAEARFWEAVQPQPLGEELVPLEDAHGRILADDVVARHNVPFFDRSNFDGFALRAEDTFGAQETAPVLLTLNPEVLACGVVPQEDVAPGTATTISTGGVLPRGADGVVMIENTFPVENAETAKNMNSSAETNCAELRSFTSRFGYWRGRSCVASWRTPGLSRNRNFGRFG